MGFVRENAPRRDAAQRAGPPWARPPLGRTRRGFGFLAWAIRSSLIDKDPTSGLKKEHETARTRVLTDDEIRTLITGFDPTRYGRALCLLFLTALRRDEVLGLRWSWIDMEKGVLTIPPEAEKMARGARRAASVHAAAPGGEPPRRAALVPIRGGRPLRFRLRDHHGRATSLRLAQAGAVPPPRPPLERPATLEGQASQTQGGRPARRRQGSRCAAAKLTPLARASALTLPLTLSAQSRRRSCRRARLVTRYSNTRLVYRIS